MGAINLFFKTTSAAMLLIVLLNGFPAALEAAEFYKGKTLRILVGFSTGGGFDVYARLVASYIGKYITGNPAVIVQNMPGAGGIVATNYLYNAAKPDGLTIAILQGFTGVEGVLGVEGIQASFANFEWLGVVASETTVLAIRPDLPHKDVDDLVKADKPLLFGATGVGGNTTFYPRAVHRFNRANVKVVTGYPGGSEVMLAIERKEVDGIARSYSSLEPFFRNKSVKPLLQSAPKRAELATVPLFVDIAPDAMAKAVFNLADAGGLVQRSFAAPPGTPKNNMQILRLAFKNTLEDPQFLADARARKLEISLMSGEEVQRRWKEIGKTPPKVVEVYKEIMEQR